MKTTKVLRRGGRVSLLACGLLLGSSLSAATLTWTSNSNLTIPTGINTINF